MLVCIESYLGDRLILGKKCSEKELRKKMKQVLGIAETKDFTTIFCQMYQFDEYPLSKEVRVDFYIDIDAHLVYAPKY